MYLHAGIPGQKGEIGPPGSSGQDGFTGAPGPHGEKGQYDTLLNFSIHSI